MIKKNLWIRNIVSCVRSFADREYQEIAWLRHEAYYPFTYEEIMCQLFDDCFLEEFMAEKADEFGLSSVQKMALSELVIALRKYGGNPEIYYPLLPICIDEAKMLKDPEWHTIQKLAQKVVEAFGKIKYESEDKEWWWYFILNAIFAYSNVDNQKCMWVDKSQTFFSTPLDMYEGLFVSCEFDYFMDEYAKKFELTEEQIVVVNRFRSQLKQTPFRTTKFENLLDNLEWQKLQMLAGEAIIACEYERVSAEANAH